MTLTALVIPVDGPVYEIQIDPAGDLTTLQAVVDGYIEALRIPHFVKDADLATAYVNDEAHIRATAANMRATDFMVPGIGLHFGDYIAGPMILAGFNPATGNHADLPPAVIDRVKLIEDEAIR